MLKKIGLSEKESIFAKNALMLYIMTALKYLMPLIIAACLTRRLGASSYGKLIYSSTMMGYFMTIIDFGFNYSATRKIAANRNNETKISEVFSDTILGKVLLVIPCVVLFTLMVNSIDLLKNNFWLTLLFFINSISNVFLPDFVYRGLEKMENITIRYGISKVVSTAFVFAFVVSERYVLLVPIIYFIGSCAAILWSLHNLKKYNICFVKRSFYKVLNGLRESSVFFISVFASASFSAIISFVLGMDDFSASDIAYWNIAIQVVIAIQSLYDPLTASLFPRMVIEKDYRKALKVTAVLTIVVAFGCVIMYFLADYIILIIAGEGYNDAAFLLKLLIPLIFFSFPAQMLGFPILGAMGKVNQVTASTVISSLFLLISIFIVKMFCDIDIVSIAIIRNCTECVYFVIRLVFVALSKESLSTTSGTYA